MSLILSPSLSLSSSSSSVLSYYLSSQNTHNTAQSPQPEYRGSVCECGGTQRTPSLAGKAPKILATHLKISFGLVMDQVGLMLNIGLKQPFFKTTSFLENMDFFTWLH